MRLLAALAVLFAHSFALLSYPELLDTNLHKSLGAIAVDVFFVASGFLVTANNGSLSTMQYELIMHLLLAFIWRIYIALHLRIGQRPSFVIAVGLLLYSAWILYTHVPFDSS